MLEETIQESDGKIIEVQGEIEQKNVRINHVLNSRRSWLSEEKQEELNVNSHYTDKAVRSLQEKVATFHNEPLDNINDQALKIHVENQVTVHDVKYSKKIESTLKEENISFNSNDEARLKALNEGRESLLKENEKIIGEQTKMVNQLILINEGNSATEGPASEGAQGPTNEGSQNGANEGANGGTNEGADGGANEGADTSSETSSDTSSDAGNNSGGSGSLIDDYANPNQEMPSYMDPDD